jgi:Fe2+ transport system protein B
LPYHDIPIPGLSKLSFAAADAVKDSTHIVKINRFICLIIFFTIMFIMFWTYIKLLFTSRLKNNLY